MPKRLCLALALVLCLCVLPGCGEDLLPVGTSAVRTGESDPVPAGSVVIDLEDSADFTAPFAADQQVAAVRSTCLALPEGSQTKERSGRARFSVTIPTAGLHYGWIRAKWNDSCGNSVFLAVADGSPSIVGEDHLYGTWHWVPAGRFRLKAGTVPVNLSEREDGVAVDQVLFTPEKSYRPVGPVGEDGDTAAVRRFADDFSRSPGHGMAGWDLVRGEWEIAFSFDPNRVPFQYSLRGRPSESDDGEAVALIEGPPWRGSRVSFSALPLEESRFGLVLDRRDEGREVRVELGLESGRGYLRIESPDHSLRRDLGRNLRPRQWHRMTVERWAGLLRVLLDGREVFLSTDLRPATGAVGLFVGQGTAFFDDFDTEQTHWWGENGGQFRVPWKAGPDARWFRPGSDGKDFVLLGRRGAISPGIPRAATGLLLREDPAGTACLVEGPGWSEVNAGPGLRLYRRPSGGQHSNRPEAPGLRLRAPEEGESRIRRLAVRTGSPQARFYEVGPYHFSKKKVADPSDYLDFTEEEYEQMRESEDASKLRRRPRYRRVVGRGGNKCVWQIRSGTWRLAEGVLSGGGPEAVLSHWQEIVSDLRAEMRVRLPRPDSAAGIQLYARPGAGASLRLAREDAPESTVGSATVRLPAVSDSDWHTLSLQVDGDRLTASLDGGEPRTGTFERGAGGGVRLRVPAGRVEFDDVEFRIPRHTPDGSFYGFEERETEWWREGGRWIDHGGLACILASSWISLVAPEGAGMLWNKRRLGPDPMVAFNLEENSEWHGWGEKPSHTHHPFDNVRVALGPSNDVEKGYRVELNARDRSATILYRNGQAVARVAQDEDFPMRYRGGHSPYSPRKNRVAVMKQGAAVRVLVNGQNVLEFQDPEPIEVSRVGLGGYRTRANFSHVEVRRLGSERMEPPARHAHK